MERLEILRFWETNHGTLSEPLRASFMKRESLRDLVLLPDWAVEEAIHEHRKLDAALAFAKEIVDRHSKTGRGATRLGGAGSAEHPRSAHYGSGLVHAPGFAEFSMGSRCEHCGAHVPDGAMHDC